MFKGKLRFLVTLQFFLFKWFTCVTRVYQKIAQKMSLCIKISFLKYPTVVAIAGVDLAIIPTVCLWIHILCDVLTAIAKRRFSGKQQ